MPVRYQGFAGAALLRRVAAWLVAVLVTYVAGAVLYTQFVLAEITALGVEVPFGDRVGATLHDVAGMQLYLMVLAVTLAVAFPVAALVIRFLPNWRRVGYVLAGFTGVIAVILLIQALVGQNPLAASRTLTGLVAQGLAGALGGWVFTRLSRRAA